MFGTIVLDAYKEQEVEQIAEAIDELCNPCDTYGWASAGIYCFWNYYTHEILYIGLARDLHDRFLQHNNLLPTPEGSCKYQYIEEYFQTHEKLGYSIFVQSPYCQPKVNRNANIYAEYLKAIKKMFPNWDCEQGIYNIKIVEGILIESYRHYFGDYPSWNKMGGSRFGQSHTMPGNINIVKCLSNPQLVDKNPIMSRSSLRELKGNDKFLGFESFLHGARQLMLGHGMEFEEAVEQIIKETEGSLLHWNGIVASNYCNKRLEV